MPTFGLRNDDDDRIPLLFVDVNITEGRNARIVIYEGDKPEDLAEKFAEQYSKNRKYLVFSKFKLLRSATSHDWKIAGVARVANQ